MGKPSFRFEQGDAIVIDGALYDLISRTDDGLEVRHLGASRVLRNLSHDEFWHLYHERNDDGARRLVVHRGLRGAVPAPVAANLSLPLEDFDPRWQDEALKRLDYVQTCSRLFSPDKPNRRGRFPMRPEGYARAARLVAGIRRRRDAKAAGKPCRAIALDVVSGSTLRDWYWRWNRSGQSLLALLPCHDAKGQIGTRLDPAVIEVMGRWLRELYLTVERPDAKPVYDCVAGEIEEKNKGLIQPLKIPSYETFLRCIKEWISPYDLVLKREGAAAGQKFRQLRRPLERPFRPFQIVEIDHTRLDVLLVSDDGKLSKGDGRKKDTYEVWLTLARCMTTKMIFGFHITREHPSWTSVMACLRMGIMEKELGGLQLENPWPCFGVPEILKMDNGLEFHSRSMEAAAGQLRMQIRYMARKSPRQKGGIERTIGDFSRGFLAFMPGKLFSNPQVRAEYDSKRHAALTLEKLRELATMYIVDIQNAKPMGVLLGRTPLQMWDSLRGYGVKHPLCADDLDAALGLTIDRTVTAVGVTFLGLVYQSEELQAIRRRIGHMGKMLMVKVDPYDLGSVMVLEEGDGGKRKGRWILVPCEYPELADGVSVVQWKEVVSLARDETEEGRKVALSKLRRARKRLAEEAMRLMTPPKKLRAADVDWSSAHAGDPWFDVERDEDDDGGDDAEGTAVRRRSRGRPRTNPASPTVRKVGDDTPPPVDLGDDPVMEKDENTEDTDDVDAPPERDQTHSTTERFRDPSTWDDD